MITLYKTDIKLYTSSEAAEILGFTTQQIAYHCNRLNAPRIGKFFLINDELLDELKHRNKQGRPKKGE